MPYGRLGTPLIRHMFCGMTQFLSGLRMWRITGDSSTTQTLEESACVGTKWVSLNQPFSALADNIHVHVDVHQYTSTHLQWNPAKPITITPKNLPVLTRWPDFKYTYMDSLHWNRKTAPTTNHFNILPCHQYCHFHTTSHGPQGVQSQHHSLHVPQVGNLSLIRRNMKLVQCGCQPGLCRYLQRF